MSWWWNKGDICLTRNSLTSVSKNLQIVSGKVLDFSILTLILPAVVIHDLPDHLMGLLVPDTHDHHMSSPHTDTHLNLASLLSSEPHLSQGDQLQSLIWREAFLNICIFDIDNNITETETPPGQASRSHLALCLESSSSASPQPGHKQSKYLRIGVDSYI